jgi:hypothetical protein
MKQRPWIAVALVLTVLLVVTAAAGFGLRSRLSDASVVLEPTIDPRLAVELQTSDDLGAPACTDGSAIADVIRAFHDAVDQAAAAAESNGEEPVEFSSTSPTFDSFLLESAIVRVAAGKHQLLVRARSGAQGWCLDEAEFTSEQ